MPWTEPATWSVSEKPLASKFNTHVRDNLNALRWQLVRKPSDTSRNTTTTLVDDPHLLLPIGISEVWAFTAFLSINDLSGAADFKMTFTGPSGAIGIFAVYGGVTFTIPSVKAFGASFTYDATNSDTGAWVSGTIVNSTTAGNLTLQWAQQSSNASNTTLKANSWLKADRTT